MMEFAVLLLILGALALVIGPRFMRRPPRQGEESWGRSASFGMTNPAWDHGPRKNRGPRQDLAQGTLLVTGVSGASPGPDAPGEHFVTITGVINGPNVDEHVVYQRMAVDASQWPVMGQLIPVVYSPKNPDKWYFAPPGQQLPPPGP